MPRTVIIRQHLPGLPKFNKETGGRDFWTGPIIEQIQKMARGTAPPFSVKELIQPFDRFDSPPYPIGDRIFLDAKKACDPNPKTLVDLSMDLTKRGGRRVSSVILGEYSFGATKETVHMAVGAAAESENFIFGIGEGGRAPSLKGNPNLMVQLATGVFGVTADLLRDACVVSIKMSQSAKIGMGGMLPKAKVDDLISETRGLPKGTDILSDASRVFSIEEVRALVDMVKSITGKPVFVKVGASHDIEFVAAGIARAGADGIIIDGRGGGTGAAPTIHRDHIGMPIEFAISLAHRQIEKIGLRDRVKIIAAGRVDTPVKAFKLVLLGADAVLLGTASLIAIGCKMYHMCYKNCPPALTAIGKNTDGTPERAMDVEDATLSAKNFYQAFTYDLSLCLSAAGFSSLAAARGKTSLLVGDGLPDATLKLLCIRARTASLPFVSYPAASKLLDYFAKLREQLAETGKYNVSSMGRATDLESRDAISDYFVHDGRTVVGPAYDSHREKIETHLLLPNDIEVSFPILLVETSSDSLRLARESNTLLFVQDSDGDFSRKIIPFSMTDLDPKLPQIRQSAGALMSESEATFQNIKKLKRLGNGVTVYVRIEASETVCERTVKLARAGVEGIIVSGQLSMSAVVPIEVAVSQINDALENEFHAGDLLRRKIKLIAEIQVRTARDIYVLNCLGADMILCDLSLLIKNPTYRRQSNLLFGIMQEYRMLMAASGLSMTSSIIGNRGILRADHELSDELRGLIGVGYIGF